MRPRAYFPIKRSGRKNVNRKDNASETHYRCEVCRAETLTHFFPAVFMHAHTFIAFFLTWKFWYNCHELKIKLAYRAENREKRDRHACKLSIFNFLYFFYSTLHYVGLQLSALEKKAENNTKVLLMSGGGKTAAFSYAVMGLYTINMKMKRTQHHWLKGEHIMILFNYFVYFSFINFIYFLKF